MSDDSRESEQVRLDDIEGTAGTADDGTAGAGGGHDRPDEDREEGPATADPLDSTVELGVELLAHVEEEMSLKRALDRIETVTTDPALTREVLDTAEMRGVIDRGDGLVRPQGGTFVNFGRDVVRREGEFTCRRCGASLSTGHFIQFDAGEHGPFGSSCIRKVTGRE